MNQLVSGLEFESVEQYYNNILDNFTNGQPKAALALFTDMPLSNRAEFLQATTVGEYKHDITASHMGLLILSATGANGSDSASNNYYRDELAQIDTDSEYAPTMRITSATGNTKYININKESAAELIQWLTIHFINN